RSCDVANRRCRLRSALCQGHRTQFARSQSETGPRGFSALVAPAARVLASAVLLSNRQASLVGARRSTRLARRRAGSFAAATRRVVRDGGAVCSSPEQQAGTRTSRLCVAAAARRGAPARSQGALPE